MLLLHTAPPPAEIYVMPSSADSITPTTQNASRVVVVRDDNGDATLPQAWRAWWHVRLDDLPPLQVQPIEVHAIAHPEPYLPVFSYDNVTWQQVAEQDVRRIDDATMVITMAFAHSRVWLAQHTPYGIGQLQTVLAELRQTIYFRQQSLGASQQGRPIYMVTITDPEVDNATKRRVLVHARTHPGEVGSSAVAEGFMRFVAGDAEEAVEARRRFVFEVVPMLNPDGVAAGNYRTTPMSENLESSWWAAPDEDAGMPFEVQHLQQWIVAAEVDGPKYSAAINLHGTHSASDELPYLVRHFGPSTRVYTSEERQLWQAQQELAEEVASAGPLMFDAQPQEGGSKFLGTGYPETFWWHRARDEVLACTFEAVYGKVGLNGGWVAPSDQVLLGEMLAKGLIRQQTRALERAKMRASR